MSNGKVSKSNPGKARWLKEEGGREEEERERPGEKSSRIITLQMMTATQKGIFKKERGSKAR